MSVSQSRSTAAPLGQDVYGWQSDGERQGSQRLFDDHVGIFTIEEVRILLKFGTSVIGQWNYLPAEVQGQLFAAASVKEDDALIEVKQRIASFVHRHRQSFE